MKKVIALFTVIFTLVMLTVAASADTFNGTLVRSNTADPNLFFYNGKYYLTQTGTSRIAVFETDTLEELADTALNSVINANIEYDSTSDDAVEEIFGEGATINGTWSPEIHYISEDMFGEKYEGWYMFLGLRKTVYKADGKTPSSEFVRNVVLKSTTGSPKGPYGHPTEGVENYSQPVLNADGTIHDEWACGQTFLTIPEGPYKGVYTMWVSEVGRDSPTGGTNGEFYQKIMIAKMKSPWQFEGTPGVVTTPTQEWEYAGASTTHPRVVEGATPVYGKNGEIFITYSGSGYWDDYGLGQLTWNGGDPLEGSSWVKLPVELGNPIFTATKSDNLRGAGHASFLTDTDGNGFLCYHAYGYNPHTETKADHRDAYIEPYYIDYTRYNGVSYGVIVPGVNGDGVAANTASTVTFATDGEYLSAPAASATGRSDSITLDFAENNAEGFIIYRSDDGEVFEYLTTTEGTQYVDKNVTEGNTYYYRAYAYREEEIGDASAIASATAATLPPYVEPAAVENATVNITVTARDNYDSVRFYRSNNGKNFDTLIREVEAVGNGVGLTLTDTVSANGTYYYTASGVVGGKEYFSEKIVSAEVNVQVSAPVVASSVVSGEIMIEVNPTSDFDDIVLYASTDNVDFVKYADKDDLYSGGGRYFFIFPDVEEGTYYYYVTAVKYGIESEPSEKMEVDFIIVPAPILNVSVSDGKILLTVTATDDYDALEIARFNENDPYDIVSFDCGEKLKNGETYSVYDEVAVCGNTYSYLASGVVSDAMGEMAEVEYTPTHNYEVTEPEISATTTSVGKTAVSTCTICNDTIGGDEIPMVSVGGADANGDGKLTLVDALRTLKKAVGMDVDINTLAADMDGDGEITVADVLLVLKKIL